MRTDVERSTERAPTAMRRFVDGREVIDRSDDDPGRAH
jgi:hypothetical protein